MTPESTTSYRITEVRDVNGVLNVGGGSATVQVYPKTKVEIRPTCRQDLATTTIL
ncbi:MAG: hypothetical protein R2751_16170 [Bacteroidales bacterium]